MYCISGGVFVRYFVLCNFFPCKYHTFYTALELYYIGWFLKRAFTKKWKFCSEISCISLYDPLDYFFWQQLQEEITHPVAYTSTSGGLYFYIRWSILPNPRSILSHNEWHKLIGYHIFQMALYDLKHTFPNRFLFVNLKFKNETNELETLRWTLW